MFAISELGRKWIQFFLISPSLPRPPRPFSSALLITYSNNNLYYLLTHREVETYSNGRSISRGMRGGRRWKYLSIWKNKIRFSETFR